MRLLTEFYIKNKKGQKVKFIPNKAQIHYLNHRTGRDIILKARQLGFTTLEQLRKLERVLYYKNLTSATVAHNFDKTTDIFRITKFAWDNLPKEVKNAYNIKYETVRELSFADRASRYYVDMDARSGTVQDLHVSEVAFNKDLDKLFASTFEAVPQGGIITLETTANGLNRFHDLWEGAVQGKNEFCPHFYNWTWDEGYTEVLPESSLWKDDYQILAKKYSLIADIQPKFNLTDGQFYWYYLKARRLNEQVKQEYPTIPEEAFLSSSQSVFDLFQLAQQSPVDALKTERGVLIFKEAEPNHRYIVGCDTSEGLSGDNTSIEVLDFTDPDNIVNVASFLDNTIRPDQVASILVDLGKKYNNAFLIPERNGSGLTTVLKIQEKGYSNLFVNRQTDKKTQRVLNEYGWRTTRTNRDMMVDDFVEAFEKGAIIINSPYVINQMKTFVRKDNGFREHDQGYHDDALFAMFLALQGNKYHRSARVFVGKAKVFS